jgi:hypothetical protein
MGVSSYLPWPNTHQFIFAASNFWGPTFAVKIYFEFVHRKYNLRAIELNGWKVLDTFCAFHCLKTGTNTLLELIVNYVVM